MSAPCVQCGGKKSHPVHLASVGMDGHHPYMDKTPGGLQPQSEGRRNYLNASKYSARSKAARAEDCAFFAAGAPTEIDGRAVCDGTAHGIHHIAPRGSFGGLEASERYPTVAACDWHNAWCQQDAEGREWARTHFFHRDGQDWPFLLSPKEATR